jgi:hypothetical protein
MPVANIATLLAFWVLPLTVWININNGHDMRRTFCGRDGADEWKAHTLYILPEGVFWVGLISVLMWIVLRLSEGFVKQTPPRYLTWLNYKASTIYLGRFAILAGLYTILVVLTYYMQRYDYGGLHRDDGEIKCACARFYRPSDPQRVYDDDDFVYADCDVDYPIRPFRRSGFAYQSFIIGLWVFGAAVASAIVVGPCLLGLVLRFGAPFFGTMAVAFVAQYRVFGPITKQSLLPGGRPFHENIWTVGLTIAYCLALLHLPFQDELPRTLHRYYARALRRNFFDQGSDAPLAALSKDIAGGVAPPNLILGCTVNEFRKPDDFRAAGKMSSLCGTQPEIRRLNFDVHAGSSSRRAAGAAT